MTTDNRTKAELAEALAYREEALSRAHKQTEAAEAQTKRVDEDWRKRFDSLDPEARAIAACVQAVEHMRAKPNRTGYSPMLYGGTTYRFDPNTGERLPEPPPPPIGSTDVGRIILHLAARYGVDLGGAS